MTIQEYITTKNKNNDEVIVEPYDSKKVHEPIKIGEGQFYDQHKWSYVELDGEHYIYEYSPRGSDIGKPISRYRYIKMSRLPKKGEGIKIGWYSYPMISYPSLWRPDNNQ